MQKIKNKKEEEKKKSSKQLVVKPQRKEGGFNLDEDANFFKLFDQILLVNNVNKEIKN